MKLTLILMAALSANATTVSFTVTPGLFSPEAGVATTTFDGLNSSATPPYAGAGATFSGWLPGQAPFVTGSVVNCNAAPLGDTSTYMAVGGCGGPTLVTVDFAPTIYAGFALGSPDAYNSVELWDGGTLLATFSGAQLIPPGVGNQAVVGYVNLYSSGGTFDRLVFDSSQAAIEVDNVAVGVPEPGTLAMIGAGLLALGMYKRRK